MTSPRATLLFLEDDLILGRKVQEELILNGYSTEWVRDVSSAIKAVSEKKFDLYLLDWELPDGTGINFSIEVRRSDPLAPLVFLTGRSDQESAVQALELGSSEFIRKPFGFKELLVRLDKALEARRVYENSVTDGLTGLLNVRAFRETLAKILQQAERVQHPLSLLFFDIDHFKKYNDTNGHPAGDEVLKGVANLLKNNFRKSDILARYGGEEFCVLLPDTDLAGAIFKAENFRTVIEQTRFHGSETQPLKKITVSIGISEFPTHASNAEDLLQLADDALYRVKNSTRNAVKVALKNPGYKEPFESRRVTVRTKK